MTWEKRQVGYLEHRPQYGGNHVIGWHYARECGCVARRGMRLDRNEQTFSALACDGHEEEVGRAMFVFGHMPPSTREVFELWEELLEREISGAVPA